MSASRPATPSVHHRALLTWLAVYSAITAVQMLLGNSMAHLPLPVRTLILTGIVVPAVVYVLVPALLRLHTWLTRSVSRGEASQDCPLQGGPST